MTRYERVQEAIGGIEHKLLKEEIESLLLVVDLPDQREELGSVHVDAARAALDWFCEKYPDHPMCVGSASQQNTAAAFREFGYQNLLREYERLYLQDFNHEPMRHVSLIVFLVGLTHEPSMQVRLPSEIWGAMQSLPSRHYTPFGEVWHRENIARESNPDLVIVDATVARICDYHFEPVPLRLDKIFSTIDLNEADRVSLEMGMSDDKYQMSNDKLQMTTITKDKSYLFDI